MAKKSEMTDEHKNALAEGRAEGRIVRSYLEALEAGKAKRGRKRTSESITKRLDQIEIDIDEADPVKRLELAQEKINLATELVQMDMVVDITSLEGEFVGVAKSYAERKGISYTAFRQSGVSASVLKQAGISRASQ